MDRMIEVTIPILIKGEPKGVKVQGGILEFVRREIQIECLPSDIPEHVDVDVTELMVGQGIRLRDVATSPKWRPLTDGDAMLVHVILAKAEEAAAAATTEVAATPTAEPEVIKKGKKEEAEAAEKKK
jgi:large subunit ribosomal protein L25